MILKSHIPKNQSHIFMKKIENTLTVLNILSALLLTGIIHNLFFKIFFFYIMFFVLFYHLLNCLSLNTYLGYKTEIYLMLIQSYMYI